jgi:phosphoribosylaminoimidazole carboxylase
VGVILCHVVYPNPDVHIKFQVRIVSAHRTPELMFSYASSAHERGIQVIIAGAGGAAHLPGKLLQLCLV